MRLLSLLAIPLLACGGDNNNHLADGGGDAGGGDGGGGGNVTVAVTLDGAPASGVQVYFENADSTNQSSAITDANGSASGKVAAGGFATVLAPQDPNAQIRPSVFDPTSVTVETIEGVQPGDVLHFDIGNADSGTPTPSIINVTVPTDLGSGVADYVLFTTCGDEDITPAGSGSGSGALKRHLKRSIKQFAKKPNAAVATNPPVQVELDGCANGSADILVVSFDADFNALNSIYAPGVAVGSDDGSGIDVTIPGPYVAVPNLNETISNLPGDTLGVLVDLDVSSANGDVFENSGETDAGSAAMTTFVVPVGMPTIPGGQARTVVEIGNGSADFDQIQEDAVWSPGPATALTLDYSTVQLKNFVTEPAFDQTSHSITWTLGSTGAAADFTIATIDIDRSSGSGSGSASDIDWTWQVAVAGAGSVTFPTLPTDVFDFNAGASDTATVDDVSSFKLPGGANRSLEFSDFITPILTGMSTGTIGIQDYEPEENLRSHKPVATKRVRATRLWRTSRNAR